MTTRPSASTATGAPAELAPAVTAADVWIGGLTDRDTAESLIGDLVEERDERPRGWYRRQLVGAAARLCGRELRRTPFGIIGSMVLGGLVGFAAAFLLTLAVVTVEAVVAMNGGIMTRTGPIWTTQVMGSVALALVAGPLTGVVAAATHRAAPLVPVLTMAIWTLVTPLLTQVISVIDPPPAGVVDSSPGLETLAQAPLQAVAVVLGGWWFARRRARRLASSSTAGR